MSAALLTEEDRAALRSEFAAFNRGMNAALRVLLRTTPLAVGSIAAVETLIDDVCTEKAVAGPDHFPSNFVRAYGAGRFTFATPGDAQMDKWMLTFDDPDCGRNYFEGEDAEREAWEAWNRYAGAWSCHLFRLARLKDAPLIELKL